MVRNFVLAAAVAAGGLGLMASAPASAANVAVGVGLGAGASPLQASVMPVYHRRWHRPRRYGYRSYRRPGVGVYIAPRPRACRWVRYRVWNGIRYVNKTRRAC